MKHDIREEPIIQDKTLIRIARSALGDKRPYGKTEATIQEIRKWLNKEVPLIEGFDVKTPKELREIGKEEELYVALQVINGDVEPRVFFDLKKRYKEEKEKQKTILIENN